MERAKAHVEDFLAGITCNANATPIVEEVLFNHAFNLNSAVKENENGADG